MFQKEKKNNSVSLKKSLNEIRKCLDKSIPNISDKELVGQVAAVIRSLRPVEVYKGKGVRYKGEVVRKKAGKSGGK